MSRSSIVDAEVSKLRALSLGGLDAFQKRDRRSPSISQISADSAVGLVGGDIDRTAAESTPLSSLTKKHIGLLLLLKTFANAALRFQYPFAPFLADSLGVSSAQYFNALAAGDAMGMLGIVIGPIADRYPPRAFVVASALLLTIGLSFAAAFRNYSVFFVSWVVVGVGYYGLAAALQAQISRCVPAAGLGKVTGVVETSYSLASLCGFPLMGLVLTVYGWSAPYLAVLAGFLPLSIALILYFPEPMHLVAASAARRSHSLAPVSSEPLDAAPPQALSVSDFFRKLLRSWREAGTLRTSYLGLPAIVLMSASNSLVVSAFGTWASTQYGFDAESFGWVSTLLGAAELTGALITSVASSRLGLLGACYLGTYFQIACFGALATVHFYSAPLAVALIVVFVTFCTSEIQFVALIAFYSAHCSPSNLRDSVMLFVFASMAAGRMASSFSVDPIFTVAEMSSIGLVALLLQAASLVLLSIAVFPSHLAGRGPRGLLCPCEPISAPGRYHKLETELEIL